MRCRFHSVHRLPHQVSFQPPACCRLVRTVAFVPFGPSSQVHWISPNRPVSPPNPFIIPPFGRLIPVLAHSVPFSVLSAVMIYSSTTVNSRSKTLNLLNLQWNCYSDWCCRRLHGGPSFLCSFAIPSLSLLTSIPKEPNPACTKQTTCVTVVQPFKKPFKTYVC